MKEISQESDDCLAVPIDEEKHEEFKPRGTRSQESTPWVFHWKIGNQL